MAAHDMPDLVPKRAGELVQPFGLFDEAAVDVNEAARKRERVDFIRVDDVEMPREVRPARLRGDRLAELLDIPGDLWIVEQRKLCVDFGGVVLADRDFLLVRHRAGETGETERDCDRDA